MDFVTKTGVEFSPTGERIEILTYHKVKKDGTAYKKPFKTIAYMIEWRGQKQVKKCTRCGNWEAIDNFRIDKQKADLLYPSCIFCERRYFDRYNRTKKGRKRYERRRELESKVIKAPDEYYDYLIEAFHFNCALTDSDDDGIVFDHVIPLSWGVVTKEKGNLLPMSITLNKEKRNRNIFDFVATQSPEIQHRFYTVVLPFLASENHMTIEEYTNHINHLEKNRH